MKRMVVYLPILALAIFFPALAHAAEFTANTHDGRDFLFFLTMYAIGIVLCFINSGIFKNSSVSEACKAFCILFMVSIVPFVGGFVIMYGYGSVFMPEEDETIGQKVAKYFVFSIAVLIMIFYMCFVVPKDCHAGQEMYYYNSRGQYQGRATTDTANPRQQSIYDNHGNYVGRVMTSPDGQQRFYDNHGNYMGRATTWPTTQPRKK